MGPRNRLGEKHGQNSVLLTTKANTWVLKTLGAQKQHRRDKWTEFWPFDNKNKHMGPENAWGTETASERQNGPKLVLLTINLGSRNSLGETSGHNSFLLTTKTNTWVLKTPGAQKQPRRETWTEFNPIDNKKHMRLENTWGPETASERNMDRILSF